MNTFSKAVIVGFLLVLSCGAQQMGDELVTVPKRYVSADGIAKAQQQSSVDAIGNWAGVGREIGIAVREGLNGVVDLSERFGKAEVGRFVLFMVAWKILGHELLAVVLGIPLFVAGVALWAFLLRRFFLPRRLLVEHDPQTKVRKWQVTTYQFSSNDGRTGAACIFAGAIVVWCVTWIAVIFA